MPCVHGAGRGLRAAAAEEASSELCGGMRRAEQGMYMVQAAWCCRGFQIGPQAVAAVTPGLRTNHYVALHWPACDRGRASAGRQEQSAQLLTLLHGHLVEASKARNPGAPCAYLVQDGDHHGHAGTHVVTRALNNVGGGSIGQRAGDEVCGRSLQVMHASVAQVRHAAVACEMSPSILPCLLARLRRLMCIPCRQAAW